MELNHSVQTFVQNSNLFFIFNFHYQDRENEIGQKIDGRKLGSVVSWSWLMIEYSGILPVVKLLVAGSWPRREYLHHDNRPRLQIQAFSFAESWFISPPLTDLTLKDSKWQPRT